MRIDYTGTGKDSQEAIDDMRQQLAEHFWIIPKFIREWLMRFGTLKLYCDGCGAHGHTDMTQNERGVWGDSGGWVHLRYMPDKTDGWVGLDFCLACQVNGGMKNALTEGRLPLGRKSKGGK